MSFWNIFSAGNTLEKTTDAIIATGDKLVFTDEEKADFNFKLRELHIRTLEAYHPFKITQRFLAIWYSFLFGIAFLVGMGVAVFNMIAIYKQTLSGVAKEKIVTVPLDPLLNVVGAFGLGGIVLAIVIFYFGGGSIESFKNTFMNRGVK